MKWITYKDSYRLVDYEDGIIALEHWNGWIYIPVKHYMNRTRALEAFEYLSENVDLTKHMYEIDIDLIIRNSSAHSSV